MSDLTAELRTSREELLAKCKVLENPETLKQLESLETCANEVGKAWGHSWLGYQSRVYYASLQPPPPGAHFSSEWGFQELYTMGTRGDWQEFPVGVVEAEIRRRAGNLDLSEAFRKSHEVRLFFKQKREDIASILRVANDKHADQFLEKLIEEAEKVEALTERMFIECLRPSGDLMSRDAIAITQGLWAPPHISILAKVADIKAPKLACESLANIARQAFSHLERTEKNQANAARIGTNVFIGHGRSKEWMDLRDFIRDRMRLPWDEFNRVPVAGIPNTVRLSVMLDAAAIAFLVFTGEDEKTDGSLQARMNVIHEAGLFQGRLGFARAIVMLEEGCQEFSNIAGLGQIRFPKNNIKAAFHDVQLILEREGLIEPPKS
jgi:predicted nucleotide-binding protein